METVGYGSLFLSAFLAATLLPFYSEFVLAGLTAVDGYETALLVAVASLGNTLGAAVNWALGRYCLHWRDRRWFPVSQTALDKATVWFNRWGVWSLLLAWLPVGGDPLTFVAGVLRVPFWQFLVLVGIGKTARYVAVAYFAEHFTGWF